MKTVSRRDFLKLSGIVPVFMLTGVPLVISPEQSTSPLTWLEQGPNGCNHLAHYNLHFCGGVFQNPVDGCQYSHLTIGDTGQLNFLESLNCGVCGKTVKFTGSIFTKYLGHAEVTANGETIYGDLFNILDDVMCPNCGNKWVNYVFPCVSASMHPGKWVGSYHGADGGLYSLGGPYNTSEEAESEFIRLYAENGMKYEFTGD